MLTEYSTTEVLFCFLTWEMVSLNRELRSIVTMETNIWTRYEDSGFG